MVIGLQTLVLPKLTCFIFIQTLVMGKQTLIIHTLTLVTSIY